MERTNTRTVSVTDANATSDIDSLLPTNVSSLKLAFSLLDSDNTKSISPEELKNIAFEVEGYNELTEEEIEDLVEQAKEDGFEDIKLEEYIMSLASMIKSKRACMPYLKAVFKTFDLKNEELIGKEELKAMMNDNGENCTDEELDQMMFDAALLNEGKLNFEDFVNPIKFVDK